MTSTSELFSVRWGSGARGIFGFHGWSGDHRTFLPLRPHVPSEVSFFSFDHPGFGQSPAPRAWSFEAVTAPLCRLIERSGLDRVELVGNCSGAFTALHVALGLGARVARVVLVDAFAYVPWYFRWLTTDPLGKTFYQLTFANPIGRSVCNLALRNQRTEDSHLTRSFSEVDHQHAHAFLRLLCSQRDVSPFAPVGAQIDLVHGERTFQAVRTSIGFWQNIWPHARVHQLAGAGHLPIEEATTELAALIFGGKVGDHG